MGHSEEGEGTPSKPSPPGRKQGLCEDLSGGSAADGGDAEPSGGTCASGTVREASGTAGALWKMCGWRETLRTGPEASKHRCWRIGQGS